MVRPERPEGGDVLNALGIGAGTLDGFGSLAAIDPSGFMMMDSRDVRLEDIVPEYVGSIFRLPGNVS